MPDSYVIRPKRTLGTTAARTQLPALVKELTSVREPGSTLADHAVQVSPRAGAGVWLVPEIDVDAAIDREHELRLRVEQLEDEAENLAIAMLLTERLADSGGGTTAVEDFVRELGFEDLLG